MTIDYDTVLLGWVKIESCRYFLDHRNVKRPIEAFLLFIFHIQTGQPVGISSCLLLSLLFNSMLIGGRQKFLNQHVPCWNALWSLPSWSKTSVTIFTDHRHHGHHQHYHHCHCHHRHHQVGMELDSEQEELWNSYTEENREKCFWLFLNSFVEKWEKQVIILISLIIFFQLKSAKNSSKTRQSYFLRGDG